MPRLPPVAPTLLGPLAALLIVPALVRPVAAQPRPRPDAGVATVPLVVPTPPGIARRLARATVTVLVGGRPAGLGVVVAPTGRVLAALPPPPAGAVVSVRYPDGRVDALRPLARDPAWGVSLWEGAAGRWPEGLPLAVTDARGRDAVSWLATGGSVATGGLLRRRRSFVGADAALLRDAWELDPVPAREATGSGLVHHGSGALVGLVLPAGDGQRAITGPLTAFGAPWEVLRALLDQAGASASPWLGLVLEEASPGQESVSVPSGGLRVASVHPEGPGARVGLRGGHDGDIVVAAEGMRVQSLAELAAALRGRQVGETITLRVVRGGAHFEVPLELAARPAER